MEAVPAARALVAELFPDALYAFLGGSVLTGHRTSRSDLDVVVVLDGLAVPYRESLRWHDWPVDLLVHNELSLTGWADRDLAGHRPTLPRLCADGVVLTDRAGRAAEVQAVMRERLSAGPGPTAPQMLDRARYVLSDLLDDLAGATEPGELAFIRWQVVQESARLALTAAGRWHGSGKWLLRELRAYDAALADELLSAHDDPVRLAAAAESVLERAGGRLWEGYRADGDPFHQRLRHIASGDLTSETAQSSGMRRLAAVSGPRPGPASCGWARPTSPRRRARRITITGSRRRPSTWSAATRSFVFLDPEGARRDAAGDQAGGLHLRPALRAAPRGEPRPGRRPWWSSPAAAGRDRGQPARSVHARAPPTRHLIRLRARAADPVDVEDALNGADGLQHMTEMLGIAHLEGELADRHPVSRGGHRGAEDVDVLVGQGPGDVGQQAGPVEGLDLDGHQEDRVVARRPAHLHQAVGLRLELHDVGAVGAVHGHAVPPGDEADDLVAGHRGAAPRQAYPDIVVARDDHARAPPGAAAQARRDEVSAMSSSAPSTPPMEATSFCTTVCAATWPSPTAA